MQRETATHSEDLPHGFQAAGSHALPGANCQVCGFKFENPLHSQSAREVASDRMIIETQKGS